MTDRDRAVYLEWAAYAAFGLTIVATALTFLYPPLAGLALATGTAGVLFRGAALSYRRRVGKWKDGKG